MKCYLILQMSQQRCTTPWGRPRSKPRAQCTTSPWLLTSISLIWMPDDLILILNTYAHLGFARSIGSPPRGCSAAPVLAWVFLSFVSFLAGHTHLRVCVCVCVCVCVSVCIMKNDMSSFFQKNWYTKLGSTNGLLGLGTACKYMRWQHYLSDILWLSCHLSIPHWH